LPDPPFRPLPAVHRLAPGVYYGWIITAGTALLSFVAVGVGFYGMAVLMDGLCSERGWSRTEVSFATSVYFVTSGISGTLVGRWVDRRGGRGAIAAGAVLMAAALLAIGHIDAAWQLLLFYPLLAVGFSMAGGVPASAIIAHWFEAKRARAMSLSYTGVSIGGVVLVPLATGLIASRGLATATAVLAALIVVVALPVALFVLRWDPREHGLLPDGRRAAEEQASAAPFGSAHPWTVAEALRTSTFWILVAAFGGILLCQVGVAMHQISLLRVHMDATQAAFAVSTTAAGSIVARLVVGTFADRVDKRRLGAGLMLVQAGAIATFALASQTTALYAASLLFGFTIGNLFMLQALLVGELFGLASFGTVLGLLGLLTQTAGGLGPFVLGLLYRSFGGYAGGLAVLVGVAATAAAVLLQVHPPGPGRHGSR
jgi:sugar phosphate permease